MTLSIAGTRSNIFWYVRVNDILVIKNARTSCSGLFGEVNDLNNYAGSRTAAFVIKGLLPSLVSWFFNLLCKID